MAAWQADLNGMNNNGQVFVVYGKPAPPPTKFYVVNDASTDRTYEYCRERRCQGKLRPE